MRDEIRKIQQLMEAADYVTDAPVATSVHLATTLRKPLLIEGHAGVGKTEIAKVMARMLGTNLIRLQCYEGLDAAVMLYEWNYQKQILHIKLHETSGRTASEEEREIFSEPFLLRRPLLQAITQIDQALAREVTRFMESLRRMRLAKVPGVAETLDWAHALAALHADHLDEALVSETIGTVLKDADDIKRFRAEVAKSGLGPLLATP